MSNLRDPQPWPALLLLLVASWCGCAPSPASAPRSAKDAPPDSHARMVAALKEIQERTLIENPFFQTRSVAEEEAKLTALGADGPPPERFMLHALLSEDYRRLGQMTPAIRHIEAALELRAQHDVGLPANVQAPFLFEVGVTYLRLGETENCIHCRTGESCILPIRGGGVHQQRVGSRKAIEYFLQVLERDPQHLGAKWLLNIAAMTLGEHPDLVPEPHRLPPDAFTDQSGFPRFVDVAGEVGLRVVSCGGGTVAEDFNEDGLYDLLTSTWDPGGQIRLFLNDGKGKFVDGTEAAGLSGITGGINLVQADYDNDGDIDVFVTRGAWLDQAGRHPNSLLQNQGGGRFRDVTFDVGLGELWYPTPTAGWADYDLDGDLDLYVGHEGPPSQLYRNDGARGFTNVTEQAGVENRRFTKSVSWGDYNNDRRPDLYVSNLNGANRLYRNNGDGTFTDVAPDLGVVAPQYSFPTWFWDVNNDGRLDLFVGSYKVGVEYVAEDFFGLPHTTEQSCLYLGTEEGGFREAAAEFGLTRVMQPMGVNFGDLDNDGFLDFYLGTGYPNFEGLMPKLMFHNVGGRKFEEATFSGGFGHLQKGHGIAFVDLDNDGDQDVFINMGGAYPGDAFGEVLYENPGFGQRWLRLKLVGVQSNRSAIGARIRADVVEDGARRSIYKWVNSGGSFGCNSLEQQLGLGRATEIEALEIYWPRTDQTQRFEHVPVDGAIEIREDAAAYRRVELRHVPFHKSAAAASRATP